MRTAGTFLGVAVLGFACCCLGLAASVTLATTSVAANQATTPRCASTGLLVIPNLSGANVATVTVSSLPAVCGGATIQAAVNNGATSSSGSATVPAGGGSVTVTLATAVAATVGMELDIVLTGP
jgi:hypothetical protein